MDKLIDRQNILKKVDGLNYIDKVYLLSYITNDLIKTDAKAKHNLVELKGLGKGMWKNYNIDNYIRNGRASWD
jgi:hypothetical protein